MHSPFDWTQASSRLLRSEVARSGLTLAQLAQKLNELGLEETEGSVKSKLHRGTFSTAFLLQCMTVLGRTRVELDGVVPTPTPRG